MKTPNALVTCVLSGLLVVALGQVAVAYLSCEAMLDTSIRSDCVVDAVLMGVSSEMTPEGMHGSGRLVVRSAAFGASPGDTLLLEWYHAGGTWGSIKSPADPDHGEWEGQDALWFLRNTDGEAYRTASKHCCVYSFGKGTDYVLKWLGRQLAQPKVKESDPETRYSKPVAVYDYLIARTEEELRGE